MSWDDTPGVFSRVSARKTRVAGVRATERAVMSGNAKRVIVARDADEKVVRNLLKLCKDKGIEVEYADSIKELGELSGLRVGAAACAILNTQGKGG